MVYLHVSGAVLGESDATLEKGQQKKPTLAGKAITSEVTGLRVPLT
jgi:hypothetical protein